MVHMVFICTTEHKLGWCPPNMMAWEHFGMAFISIPKEEHSLAVQMYGNLNLI